MQKEMPNTRRRHLLATSLSFVLCLLLGTAWRAWQSGGADWLPGWGALGPAVIGAVIYYRVLLPSSDARR